MRFQDDSAETVGADAHCQPHVPKALYSQSPVFPRLYVHQIDMVSNGTMTKGAKFPGQSVPQV